MFRSIQSQAASIQMLAFLTTVVASHFVGTFVSAQTLLDVNFDNSSINSGFFTEPDVNQAFGPTLFTNGVDEGRVSLVTGAQAFGGSGASLKVQFPANTSGPSEGGAQWLAELNSGVDEAYLSYRIKFGSGFDFVRGGKLPGLAGGTAPSGSVPADGWRGWSGRMMWRTDFAGISGQPAQNSTNAISYAKHVNSGFDKNGKQEDTDPWFDRDGAKTELQADIWYTIRQHVRMNTPQ